MCRYYPSRVRRFWRDCEGLRGIAKRKQAEQERIQAGLRLIEVKVQRSRNVPDSKMSGTFDKWLAENNIPKMTAHRLMKLAGLRLIEVRAKCSDKSPSEHFKMGEMRTRPLSA